MEPQLVWMINKALLYDTEKCPHCGVYNVVGEKCQTCMTLSLAIEEAKHPTPPRSWVEFL